MTWRGRWGLRLRVRHGGGRLGLLLRVRVRLSGIVGLLLRSVEDLRCRCRPAAGGRRACGWPAPRASGPAPCRHTRLPERDQTSYTEAIADCLEFIKRNSVPAEDYGSLSARR